MRFFNLLALTACLSAATAVAQTTPPATWQEHWFEHNQVLSLFYADADVAIYYDNDVSRNISWMNKFTGDVWRYTKQTYGDFGGKPQLYSVFHAYKYGGGHPSTWYDASHDYRNTIDIGQAGDWQTQGGWNYAVITHEISHIVELGSKGVHGSPAFGLWGDSKWAEIFIYDVFTNLGYKTEANAFYTDNISHSDSFPRANTFWFRDWFYPIYSQYGGNKVLNRYFELVAQYFPKNGNNYSRSMNWGEFVVFWSAAAGTDLKPLATKAFGWPADWEAQYQQAKIDFKFNTVTVVNGPVTSYQHCDFGGNTTVLPLGNLTLSQLTGYGFVNDDMSSIKVLPGYKAKLFTDDNFTGSTLTATANDTCLASKGFNDNITSIQISPNGDTSLTGRFYLKNKSSGLYMDVAGGSTAAGANIVQSAFSGATQEQFEFVSQGDGVYAIRNVNSGKNLDVDAISTNDGAKLVQWDSTNNGNQKFVAFKSGANYQLIATHSYKSIRTSGTTAGASIQQWQNTSELSSQWELIPVTTNNGFTLTVQAEKYTTASNVGLENTTDTGAGQNVGWIDTGDWLTFNTITIPASGNYLIEYRVASPNTAAKLSLDLNSGATVLGQLAIPNTGGWQNWTTISHTVYINAGTYNFGVFAQTGGWNINWFKISEK
jgi:hypothetical protein